MCRWRAAGKAGLDYPHNCGAGDGSSDEYSRIAAGTYQSVTVPEPLSQEGWQIIDGKNQFSSPGFFDLNVSFGEPGLETNTRKVKFGDGVTAWQDLEYGITGDLEIQGTAIRSKDG